MLNGQVEEEATHMTVAEEVAMLPPIPNLVACDSEPIAPPFTKRPPGICAIATTEDKKLITDKSELMSDANAWRRIGRSLVLQLSYRNDEDVAITLKFLQRIPFFHALSSSEMLTVMDKMHFTLTRGTDIEVARVTDGTKDVKSSPRPGFDGEPLEGIAASLLDPSLSISSAPEDTRDATCKSKEKRLVESPVPLTGGVEPVPHWTDVSVQDDDTDGDAGLYVLVVGKLLMELPTAAGRQHFPVLAYDTFGYPLMTNVLPVGTRFVTAEPCMFVRLKASASSTLERLLTKSNDRVLRNQFLFLKNGLSLSLFAGCPDTMIEACARNMLPLRLSTRQVLVEEGEESDAMFFISGGKILATRSIRSQLPLPAQLPTQRAKPATLAAETLQGSPRSRRRPGRRGHVMEVTAMHCGEICGEVGLLAYNPDTRPGEGIVWSADYWRAALLGRFVTQEETDVTSALFTGSTVGTGPSATDTGGDPLNLSANATHAHEAVEELRYPPIPMPRKATLYAQQPSQVYRLSYAACRKHLHGIALTRLQEYVKGYPSHDDLQGQYEQQHLWDSYREDLLKEVMQNRRR